MRFFKSIRGKVLSTLASDTPAGPRDDATKANDSAPLSIDDVRNCYRFLLGREPENDRVAAEKLAHVQNFYELRKSFLLSPEFREQYKALANGNEEEHPYTSRTRTAVAFVHLLKTGGTTFHAILEQNFARNRTWPHHHNSLHRYPPAELAQFDLFSGHFDIESIGYIPRAHIKTVSIFRRPEDRLISFYRFLKSHPAAREFEHNLFIHLARQLSVEEFFEHPDIRSRPEIWNHYLLVFGFAYAQTKLGWPPAGNEITRQGFDLACERVRALAGIGITERLGESMNVLLKALDLPIPASFVDLQVTDTLPDFDARFSRVGVVDVTARLAEALRELTHYDDQIYQVALAEYERRLI